MFKRTLPFFTTPTIPCRYAAMLDMGLFHRRIGPNPADKTAAQQIIENKLAYPEQYELQRVLFPKKVIDKLKEELLSSDAPTY